MSVEVTGSEGLCEPLSHHDLLAETTGSCKPTGSLPRGDGARKLRVAEPRGENVV